MQISRLSVLLLLAFSSIFFMACETSPPQVVIETEYGNMVMELSDKTPQHRDNFIKLVKEGYYDSLLFHRVIPGFMLQGGDPDSKNAAPGQMLGGGGPGYTVPAEFSPELIHVKGAVAAARRGDNVNPEKASSGSQFYIVEGAPFDQRIIDQIEKSGNFQYTPEQIETYKNTPGAPFLDGQYTVFGHIVEGLDVIDKIAAVQTGPGDRPVKDVRMKVYMK